MTYNDLQRPTMTNLNDFQSKRKRKSVRANPVLNEQKTSVVRCHAMLQHNTIVSCTASLVHINIRIITVSFIHTFISLFLNQSASQAFSCVRHVND